MEQTATPGNGKAHCKVQPKKSWWTEGHTRTVESKVHQAHCMGKAAPPWQSERVRPLTCFAWTPSLRVGTGGDEKTDGGGDRIKAGRGKTREIGVVDR